MQKGQITTESIIIKRINYKDADKILTLYTRDLGKVTAIAKGVRKMTSKRKGHLELLNQANLHLINSHNWYVVAQTELIDSFSKIKSNPYSISVMYYIAETFDKLIPEGEENRLIYQFLSKTLENLDSSFNYNLLNAYNVKILKILGFHANIKQLSGRNDINTYLDTLLTSTYAEINMISKENNLIIESHLLLKEYTEEILEREIKTTILFSS